MADYLAKFSNESETFHTLAATWPAPSDRLVPLTWWQVLRKSTDVDIALRIAGGSQSSVTLLLTAAGPEPLLAVSRQLQQAENIPGFRLPADAARFDEMTELSGADEHLRVSHSGYHQDGIALGCDFRLFSAWAGNLLPDGLTYQVTLHPRLPNPDSERMIRKYLAWLELEQPFTPAVRDMQGILGRRLMYSGWLADEYLVFDSLAQKTETLGHIVDQFAATTGRIGFSGPPVESGDFSAWLTTGCHTARNKEEEDAIPVMGAELFSESEIEWLISHSQRSPQATSGLPEPAVFISYASADLSMADEIRRQLEDGGRRCWIAPRDINREGLPYTEAIARAIKKVHVVLVLLSPSANLSVHIPRELDLALEHHLPIIPLRLENVMPHGQLEYLLRTCQWLDLFAQPLEHAMSELELRLQSLDQLQTDHLTP